jgi:hypothetical protein
LSSRAGCSRKFGRHAGRLRNGRHMRSADARCKREARKSQQADLYLYQH